MTLVLQRVRKVQVDLRSPQFTIQRAMADDEDSHAF